MVADLESGKEIDENTELRPQEQKNDCYTKEELLGQLIFSSPPMSPLIIVTPQIVTHTLIVTPFLASRKCDYYEWRQSLLGLILQVLIIFY